MSYYEHLTTFAGQEVVDFNDESDWAGPDKAYRLAEEYDDETSLEDRLQALVSQPEVARLRALVIGAWSGACEGGGAEGIVGRLAELAHELPGLRALFLGEMTMEECELSWINQTEVTPVLQAYPNLETLRIRGSEGLSFGKVSHAHLKELAIESGGLRRSVLREVFSCEFPELEHLELLLGEENYGWDGSVEDLQPLLSGKLYPKLKYLGLMNATIANDIAAVVVNSPMVHRIETLNLGMGNLDNEGVKSLLGLAGRKNLKTLDISHHYATEEAIEELRKWISAQVIANDPQGIEDDWRPILHAE